MKSAHKFHLVIIMCLFYFGAILAQNNGLSTSLPRSTPEAEGMSSKEILNFFDAAAKSNFDFHSIMIVRHGKVVTEAWWAPYRRDLKHTLYSCSKSFTATAVGFAVQEGKLKLDDKVISFFPEYLPKTVSPYLAELTIKDLLSMTVGMDPDPSFSLAVTDDNWIKGFFNTPIINKPGTVFLYNSLGTYMAGAIVQKVTGQSLIEYLKPRLFDPLGIEGMDWEKELLGYNVGGWGLRVKTEDMAKFALLFLQKGKWNGKQLISEAWVDEATSMKILQSPTLTDAERSKNDWAQGYCYQMWRSRHNSYRGDGAYGQLMLVLPEQDAVIAVTAEISNMQAELDLIWDNLLPAFGSKEDSNASQAASALKHKIGELELKKAMGKSTSPLATSINNTCFKMHQNELNLKSIEFEVEGGTIETTLTTDKGKFELNFGAGTWKKGTTKKLGPYLARVKGYFQGLPSSKVVGTYGWLEDNTLQLQLRYIESPHTETYNCKFNGDKITVEYAESQNFGNKKTIIEGQK